MSVGLSCCCPSVKDEVFVKMLKSVWTRRCFNEMYIAIICLGVYYHMVACIWKYCRFYHYRLTSRRISIRLHEFGTNGKLVVLWQGRNDGVARGAQFPGRRITAWGAEKSQQCRKYFLHYSTYAAKTLGSQRGVLNLFLTSLRPCPVMRLVFLSDVFWIMQASHLGLWAPMLNMLLQPLCWRCVECVIHHERDVREEQHPYICGANKQ